MYKIKLMPGVPLFFFFLLANMILPWFLLHCLDQQPFEEYQSTLQAAVRCLQSQTASTSVKPTRKMVIFVACLYLDIPSESHDH